MPIRVVCIVCGKSITVPDHYAGRKGRCGGCNSVVVIPSATTPPISPPPAVPPPPPSPALKHLKLTRPLAVIDLETTGVDVKKDRIVEIGILRIEPSGGRKLVSMRCNPGVRIPTGASAVHGIRDADVVGKPPFAEIAPELVRLLDGCDFAGFNVVRYDLPMFVRECDRAGAQISFHGRYLADAMAIYHKMEPRTKDPRNLSTAVWHYCGRIHDKAHSAGSDVVATLDVLDAQVGRYPGHPDTVGGLHARYRGAALDIAGFFHLDARGRIVFGQGKHKGKPLEDIAKAAPSYLEWMLDAGFTSDTLRYVRQVLPRGPGS